MHVSHAGMHGSTQHSFDYWAIAGVDPTMHVSRRGVGEQSPMLAALKLFCQPRSVHCASSSPRPLGSSPHPSRALHLLRLPASLHLLLWRRAPFFDAYFN